MPQRPVYEQKPPSSKLIRLGADKRLVLKNNLLSRRIASLFNELSQNEELQKTFIESPMEVIGHEVLEKNYTPEQASAVNKFIFSVLANEELQKWYAKYDAENAGRELTPEQRLEDLATAFIRFGDPSLVAGLSLMTGLIEIAATGAEVPGISRAAIIVKAESVAVGNWFVYKVSGRTFGRDEFIFPAAQVQKIAEQLLARARELKETR